RGGHRVDDLAVRVGRGDVGEVLRHGLPGYRHAVTVQEPRVEQGLHHDGDAADGVDVGHDVATERFDVGEVRHLVADAIEVVEREFDLGLVRDREQVQ